jgi:apolipoprotein D and lipocalin family protein
MAGHSGYKACTALACAVLLGCSNGGPEVYRDTDVAMGASSRFDAEAFAGEWMLAASFTPVRLEPVRVTYAPEVRQIRVASDEAPQIAGVYRERMPGELVPVAEDRERLIVMWVDEDYDTAAVGTMSGTFGAVLDRDGVLPVDRARAARDILAFYGWDVANLKRTKP